MNTKKRCGWVPLDKQDYIDYHDNEWGVAVHDDRKLFEMLCLEGAQAGLSWYTILKKREGYRKAFKNFDVKKVAAMTDEELETILQKADIVRNRLKVFSVRKNALACISLQQEFGSFDVYLWSLVSGTVIIRKPQGVGDFQTTCREAEALSKDLKKRGFTFVGPSIIYAYMQAVGLVNDHQKDCFLS